MKIQKKNSLIGTQVKILARTPNKSPLKLRKTQNPKDHNAILQNSLQSKVAGKNDPVPSRSRNEIRKRLRSTRASLERTGHSCKRIQIPNNV
jgi:hypothetical protein